MGVDAPALTTAHLLLSANLGYTNGIISIINLQFAFDSIGLRLKAQKLISSSMSRHLSTHKISSKSIHAFVSNFANRQTDRQMQANTFTSSFVGGNDRITSRLEDTHIMIK